MNFTSKNMDIEMETLERMTENSLIEIFGDDFDTEALFEMGLLSQTVTTLEDISNQLLNNDQFIDQLFDEINNESTTRMIATPCESTQKLLEDNLTETDNITKEETVVNDEIAECSYSFVEELLNRELNAIVGCNKSWTIWDERFIEEVVAGNILTEDSTCSSLNFTDDLDITGTTTTTTTTTTVVTAFDDVRETREKCSEQITWTSSEEEEISVQPGKDLNISGNIGNADSLRTVDNLAIDVSSLTIDKNIAIDAEKNRINNRLSLTAEKNPDKTTMKAEENILSINSNGSLTMTKYSIEIGIPSSSEMLDDDISNNDNNIMIYRSPIGDIANSMNKPKITMIYGCTKCKRLFFTDQDLQYHVSNVHDVTSSQSSAATNNNDNNNNINNNNNNNNLDANRNVINYDDHNYSLKRNHIMNAATSGRPNIDDTENTVWSGSCEKRLEEGELGGRDDQMFKCDFCSCKFTRSAKLKLHTRRHHAEAGQLFYGCGYCKNWFYTQNDLDKHAKIHAPIRCARCGNILVKGSNFNHSWFLSDVDNSNNKHRNNNNNNNNNYNENDLNVHCDRCETLLLNSHQRKKHACEKWYKCSFCEKLFNNASNYNRHVRIHQDETKFAHRRSNYNSKYNRCCNNARNTKKLTKNLKRFECDICNRRFEHAINLNLHKTSHIDRGNSDFYSCNYCKQWFDDMRLLSAHLLKRHSSQ